MFIFLTDSGSGVFTPPPPLSGPTTKQKLFFMCVFPNKRRDWEEIMHSSVGGAAMDNIIQTLLGLYEKLWIYIYKDISWKVGRYFPSKK